MKAMVARELGGPEVLALEEVPSPVPGPGDVRVRVLACGVNFADSLRLKNKYQTRTELPFTPGSEICGEVLEAGEGVDIAPGTRVIGLPRTGGYAQEALVPAATIVPVPDGMSAEIAAAFPIAYGTSEVALNHRAQLQPGETLLVHGAAGGVGLTAVEIGKAMGARVIATAGGAGKLEIAASRGADILIDYRTEDIRDRVREMTGGRGADVIYDPVGGKVFESSLRCINFEGRILTIGYASGDIPQIPANILLVKTVSVLGLNWPAYIERRPEVIRSSFARLMAWFEDGRIRPLVSKTFTLEETPAAITHVLERKALGKVVVMP